MNRALVPLWLVPLWGCTPPDPSELFNEVTLSIASDEGAAAEHFVAAIDDAVESLHIALPAGEDTELSDAIVRAYARGLEIEVVTDYDLAATPAILSLLEEGVPTALRDAGLTYFEFNQNADVLFPSTLTRMAHAYVVTDRKRIVAASTIGTTLPGTRVVFDIRGEEIVADLLSEHRQIYGGNDAVAVDTYSAPTKSIVDPRWRYGTTSDADLEMWFGPQERVLKRVIDSVYSARTAVWILTDDLVDEGLARALQTKARWGFDVQVVVGPRFGQTNSLVSRIFEQGTPDVQKRRLVEPDPNDPELGVIPTLVLVDYPEDAEGYRPYSRAFVLNHDLYSAARLYQGSPIVTDQLIDSAMWVLSDVSEPDEQMQAIEEVFRDHLDRSSPF